MPRAFEIWRSQDPPATATTLTLDKLEIPARETASMVRVRGVLLAPQTGGYTIQVIGVDPAEFFLADGADGAPAEWRLVQRNGNPNTGAGRVKLEQGVAKRFEYWTMGRGRTSVQWELASRASEQAVKNLLVAKQPIPATSMAAPTAKPGERHANGLLDNWKQQAGLDVDSGEGPNGPWGDKDNDGVPNWLEQISGGNPLKPDSEGRDGLIRFEVWRNIPGKYVFDLTRSRGFPQHPDEIRYLRRLEIPVGNGNDYGSRLRGLIKPPATGEYTFLLAANDTAELWIGEDESWQTKKLIARADQQGAQARWTRAANQGGKPLFPEQMAKVSLKKGQRYYIEVLHKQSNNEDSCAVAWIPPGAVAPEVIGPDSLVSWQRAKDDPLDTGLPDSWRQSSGLMADSVNPADRTAYADPDHDGLTNFEEWKGGTDPLKADAVATKNMLTCEVWTDLPGDRIQDLVLNNAYPVKPTHATLVDNMDFSQEGDNYGCRLRGFLTAPDDGPYIFYISGNAACMLYLAESEDKFTKHVIAKTIHGTGWRAYGQNVSQQSEPIELKAGQRYYIEVLFKRGARQDPAANPRDHASVAWKRPDRLQTVIQAAYFSPYQKDPRDLDDHDLLDSWEIAHKLDPKDPTGVSGAWGDPDGDLLDNFTEMQSGLDPQVADAHGAPGIAMWECWEGIVGDLAALKADLSFPLHPTRREWVTSLEGPSGLGNSYGSRLRAYLIPPVTGDYTFAIAGDNQCELWLSPSELKYYKVRIASVERWTAFREWDKEPGQVSKPIHLEAGRRYFIEALHKQDTKQDHVSVAFKAPSSKEFEVIRGKALAGFASDPADENDNDIPDAYERQNGMSPDGRDADKDLDGDGLTNRQEFLLGTRANLKDSDGDGASDGDEVNIYHTNPLVKDMPPPVLDKTAPLAQWLGTAGSWMAGADGTLDSMERRGEASWDVEVTATGVYLIEVLASARGATTYVPSVPVTVLIDGMVTLSGLVQVGEQPTRLAALTRPLAVGKHRVTLDNRNVRAGVGIAIVSVNLYRHEGLDADTDGIPDWLENLCGRTDGLDQGQTESAVSPVCIEGEARFTDDVSLVVGAVAVPVHEGLPGRWFADVPLNPVSPVDLKAAFEGGAIIESAALRWIVTNLMVCPDVLRVRAGDALLLSAYPEATDPQAVTFEVGDGADFACSGHADKPLQVRFAKAGRAVLSVTAGTSQETRQTRRVTVEVRSANFGSNFNVAVGYPRDWELPQVAKDLFIETDPRLTLAEQATPPQASRLFTVTMAEIGVAHVLARLGDGGAVLAAATVNGFFFASATVTGNSTLLRVLPDGTRVVQVGYVIDGPVPADLSIWLRLYVTDAVFANGDTWYHLTAADFDAKGMAKLTILKAPGKDTAYVCHWIMPYGSGEQVRGRDDATPAATAPTDPETPVSPELVPTVDASQSPTGRGQ